MFAVLPDLAMSVQVPGPRQSGRMRVASTENWCEGDQKSGQRLGITIYLYIYALLPVTVTGQSSPPLAMPPPPSE